MLAVGVHAEAVREPAAHVEHGAQGAKPDVEYCVPAAQGVSRSQIAREAAWSAAERDAVLVA